MTAGALIAILFVLIVLFLLSGYPVAFVLAGVSLMVALLAAQFGLFDAVLLQAIPSRIYGIMQNPILLTIPMFVLMGNILERSGIAADLLTALSILLRRVRGGLGVAVVVVGVLMGASTGIVGATVVTLSIFALPTLLAQKYPAPFASGVICATGTLGQIVPPSIVLILLGDVLSSSWQEAQLRMGNFSPSVISIGDLFAGAILPSLLLGLIFVVYVLWVCRRMHPSQPLDQAPMQGATPSETSASTVSAQSESQDIRTTDSLPANAGSTPLGGYRLWFAFLFPCLLIIAVLGSIIAGIAVPSEASAVGVLLSLMMAKLHHRDFDRIKLKEALIASLKCTAMIFMILIGATIFSLVFRGLGGDDLVHRLATYIATENINPWWVLIGVMLLIFLLGFILDFIEIITIVVPIIVPLLTTLGFDPLWLGILICLNLQTSFLTPPFGFSLFYFRATTPDHIATTTIYRGVMPFVGLQLLALAVVALVPELATSLPQWLYR